MQEAMQVNETLDLMAAGVRGGHSGNDFVGVLIVLL